MKEYSSINGEFSSVNVIEHSKFISYVKGVDGEEAAKDFLQSIRKLHSLSTHICYAYIADADGRVQKFSDDGEPQGTAGKPILEVLKTKDLRKICAVVVRYFGGIKLGTGGLARAYSSGVVDTLKLADIKTYKPSTFFSASLSYEEYRIFNRNLVEKCVIVSIDYNECVTVKIAVPCDDVKGFLKTSEDVYKGRIIFKTEEVGYFSY